MEKTPIDEKHIESSVESLRHREYEGRIFLGVLIWYVICSVLGYFEGPKWLLYFAAFVSLVSAPMFLFGVLSRGPAIFAGDIGYYFILIGIGIPVYFASAYQILVPLSESQCLHTGEETALGLFDSLYFSYVAFTTVGFGDIQPAGVCKAVAAFEAIIGYISLGILVAVSLEAARRSRFREEEQAEFVKRMNKVGLELRKKQDGQISEIQRQEISLLLTRAADELKKI